MKQLVERKHKCAGTHDYGSGYSSGCPIPVFTEQRKSDGQECPEIEQKTPPSYRNPQQISITGGMNSIAGDPIIYGTAPQDWLIHIWQLKGEVFIDPDTFFGWRVANQSSEMGINNFYVETHLSSRKTKQTSDQRKRTIQRRLEDYRKF